MVRLVIADDLPGFYKLGADEIAAVVNTKKDACVVLPTGNTPLGVYAELAARCARREFDATSLRLFQLDEYLGLSADDQRTLFGWMDRVFMQPMAVPLQQVVRLPSDTPDHIATCLAYDKAVEAAGGFDLAVLGLGLNGHIGFNEPGSHAQSRARALVLTPSSLNSNAAYWGGRESVPRAVMTCGMQHLLAARKVILLVSGERKSEILFQALHGPITPEVPASYLQTVADLVVVADTAAASKLIDAVSGATPKDSPPPSTTELRSLREDLFLGVDAGNSKTVAIVTEASGRVLGYGRAGGGDMYGVTPAGAILAVDTAVQTALSMAGARQSRVAAAAFSMAGADWPEDYELLRNLLAEQNYCDRFVVENDSVGALRAGSPLGWGVGITCGTWVALSARSRKGAWIRGFHAPPGGGMGLAQAALNAVYCADAGTGPQTRLTECVLAFFKQERVIDVHHEFTKREGSKPQALGRLAHAVLDLAAQGDPVALKIVLDQARDLGIAAVALARKANIDKQAFPLVVSGGVFRHPSTVMVDTISATVRTQAPRAVLHRNRLQPVAGALMLALEAGSIRVGKRIRRNLNASMPNDSFFAT